MFTVKGGLLEIITKEKQIQNDKERIFKKFNFHNVNSNLLSNKTENQINNDHKVSDNLLSPFLGSEKVTKKKNKSERTITPSNSHLHYEQIKSPKLSVNGRNKTPLLRRCLNNKDKKKSCRTPINYHNRTINTNDATITTNNTTNMTLKSKGTFNNNTNNSNINKSNVSFNSIAFSKEHILKVNNKSYDESSKKCQSQCQEYKKLSVNSVTNSCDTEKESQGNLTYELNNNEYASTNFRMKENFSKLPITKISPNVVEGETLIPIEHPTYSITSKSIADNEMIKGFTSSSFYGGSSKTSKDEKEKTIITPYKKTSSNIFNPPPGDLSVENSENSLNVNYERQADSDSTEKQNCMLAYEGLVNDKQKEENMLFSNVSKNCLLSQRIVNDELINYQPISPNNDYKFISKIREENNKLQELNLKKFLSLDNSSIFNLLSFIYDDYENNILKENNIIYSKINFSMDKVFTPVINNFKKAYGQYFQIEKYLFKCTNFVFHRRNFPLFNLLIKVKIIIKNYGTSYEFGYKYKKLDTVGLGSNTKEFENIWKFDLKKKNNSPIWFSSEVEYFKGTPQRFCFAQPILNFDEGDSLILTMNIFSKTGAINPSSIIWKPMIVESAPKGFFQKSLLKSPYAYDKLRACEIENMVRFWRNENSVIKRADIIKDFRKIFGKIFSIEQILFDFSKIFMFKILMSVTKEGILNKNKFCNFCLEAVPKESSISYELQSIFLLNSNYINDKVQIRVGTSVIFYIIENRK